MAHGLEMVVNPTRRREINNGMHNAKQMRARFDYTTVVLSARNGKKAFKIKCLTEDLRETHDSERGCR